MSRAGYIDSSVLLGKLLNDSSIEVDLRRYDLLVSSELLLLECSRTIDRFRIQGPLLDQEVAEYYSALESLARGFRLVKLSSKVLERARGSFPTVLGSLDSLHLASLLRWSAFNGKEIDLITHDHQLGIAATSLGYNVVGVQSEE